MVTVIFTGVVVRCLTHTVSLSVFGRN